MEPLFTTLVIELLRFKKTQTRHPPNENHISCFGKKAAVDIILLC